jgi:hypothetical protein
MVKGGVANTSPSQSATQASTFVDHHYPVTCLLQIIGCAEAGKASANN